MQHSEQGYLTLKPAVRYAIVLCLFALALALRFALLPVDAGLAFVTFYPVILICFYLCGTGPGILLAVLSGLAGDYFFIPPYFAFPIFSDFSFVYKSIVSLSFFALTCFLIGYLIAKLNRHGDLLSELNRELHSTNQELQQARDRFSLLIKSSPAVIYTARVSGDFGVTFMSENIVEMMGYTPEDFTDNPSFWIDHIHPDDRAVMLQDLGSILDEDKHHYEYRFQVKDGSYRWMHDALNVVRDKDHQPIELVGYWDDISHRKEMERQLLIRNFSLDHADDEVYWVDSKAKIIDVNETACKKLGYTRDETLNFSVDDIDCQFDMDHWSEHWQKLQKVGTIRLESVHKTKDGKTYPVEIVANHVAFDDQELNCAFARDMTEIKALENQLLRQARIDFLTQVNNRGYFMEQAEIELSRAVRYGDPFSLLMLDIDFFKQVNDSHGHQAGDAVLVKLASIMRQTLREVDIIGRIGGEEFAILLPETGLEKSFQAAERLRINVSNTKVPIGNGLPLKITVSIGIASMTSNDDNIDLLLSQADAALYEAKHAGRNKVCIFKSEML